MAEPEKRSIFISHVTEDAALASKLGDLIRKASAGNVSAWYSSDTAASGGIKPGEPWYQRIHDELRAAERVFAVVTPTSAKKPWVYWESAIGSVQCDGRVAAVVFKMQTDDLTPPLSYYEAIRGLDVESITTALVKISVNPYEDMVRGLAETFVRDAEGLLGDVEGPFEGDESESDPVAALYGPLQNIVERLDRMEKELAKKAVPAPSGPSLSDTLVGALRGEQVATDMLRSRTKGTQPPTQRWYFFRLLEAAHTGGFGSGDLQQTCKRIGMEGAFFPEYAQALDKFIEEETPGPWENE